MGLPGSGLLRVPSLQASLRACPPRLEHPRDALSTRQPPTQDPTTGWPRPLCGLPAHSHRTGRGRGRQLQKQRRRREMLEAVAGAEPRRCWPGRRGRLFQNILQAGAPSALGVPRAERPEDGRSSGPASAAPERAESGRGGGGGGVGPPPAAPRTKAEPWERNAARAPRRPRPLAPRGRRPGHPLGLMNPPLCGTVTPR